jgi:RHS repeat-associated protein
MDDPATSLENLGAREYNPASGRFVSADPVLELTDPTQMGGYDYAGNNPVTGSDPTGLMMTSRCVDECGNYVSPTNPNGNPRPSGPADTADHRLPPPVVRHPTAAAPTKNRRPGFFDLVLENGAAVLGDAVAAAATPIPGVDVLADVGAAYLDDKALTDDAAAIAGDTGADGGDWVAGAGSDFGGGYIDLYHGTNKAAAANIRANGVDPGHSPRPRDFGDGFYATKNQGQAQEWARQKFGSNGVVLHFRVPADEFDSLS